MNESTKIRILIVGVGNPVPTFIRRRLVALAESGVDLVVMLGYGQSNIFPPEVEVVRYGDVGQMSFWDFFKFGFAVAFRPFDFFKIYVALRGRPIKTRVKLTVRYFPMVLPRGIQFIHVQWLGLAADLFWLRAIHRVPMLASVRGSQVTVYPITRVGYAELMRSAFRLTDFVHVVGRDLIQACLNLGASAEKIVLNYNGVDTTKFKPATPPDRPTHDNGHFALVTIGSLMWRKGILFQLMIVKDLLERGVPVHLTLIGEGADREALVYQMNMLNLDNVVKLAGRQEEAAVIHWLQKADAYVSTSVAEGLPNSLVEAAACALPIVSFSCEGALEVVEEGVTGFVVPFGDVKAASDSLFWLWQNRLERKQMGANGRLRVQKYFEEKDCVCDMIENYRKMLGVKVSA